MTRLGESASPGRCFRDNDTWDKRANPRLGQNGFVELDFVARFRRLVELSSGLSASRQLCFAELEFVVQREFVVVRGSRRVENVSVQSSSVSSI